MNFSFLRTKSDTEEEYVNLMVLMALPQLMHGAFVNANMQQKILSKVKNNLTELKSKNLSAENLGIVSAILQDLDQDKEKKPAEQAKPKVGRPKKVTIT